MGVWSVSSSVWTRIRLVIVSENRVDLYFQRKSWGSFRVDGFWSAGPGNGGL